MIIDKINSMSTNAIVRMVKKACRTKGYKFFEGAYNVNLVSFRGKERDPERFSDVMLLIYQDHYRNWVVEYGVGTTVPGLFAHYHFSNPLGTGILVPGQYRGVYGIGNHKGSRALVQKGKFKVYRDKDKDGKIDKDKIFDSGPEDGFNYHAAISKKYPEIQSFDKIGRFSEGCQVVAFRAKHSYFMDVIEYSMSIFKSNTITYTLFDEEEL